MARPSTDSDKVSEYSFDDVPNSCGWLFCVPKKPKTQPTPASVPPPMIDHGSLKRTRGRKVVPPPPPPPPPKT